MEIGDRLSYNVGLWLAARAVTERYGDTAEDREKANYALEVLDHIAKGLAEGNEQVLEVAGVELVDPDVVWKAFRGETA